MKKISNLIVNTSKLPATSSSRSINILGEKDAEFILQVFDSSDPVKFYDFKSKSFSSTFTSTSNLKVKMSSNSFTNSIIFPASSSSTYTILLLAPVNKDTELDFGKGKNSYSTTITQVGNTTLTFTPITTATSSYEAMPTSVGSTASPATATSTSVVIDWTVTNKDNDANGFGLRLIRQPVETDWYFTPTLTYTIDGAVAPTDANSGLVVKLDNITDLAAGMYITAVAGGSSLSGEPVISTINTTTKELKMTSAQTFTNGHTLTFQARRTNIIENAIGARIDFSEWGASIETATSDVLSKTVRGVVDNSTTVTLNGTRGISGGNFVSISGVGVKNSSDDYTVTNKVTTNRTDGSTATASEAAGEIIVNPAQTFKGGESLKFDGSTLNIRISNSLLVESYPTSGTRIIYLNLDNFITPGVQTAS